MMKKISLLLIALTMLFSLAACGGGSSSDASQEALTETAAEKTTVNVFAAASLSAVMDEFEKNYEAANENVDVVINADSSGALLTQIQEGAPCDVFFSAAQKQMDELEGASMLVEGTRKNVVNNQLVVITQPDSETAVTGLANIGAAKSIALADGSVPVGKYTRQAMIKLGLLQEAEDPAAITTAEVSEQLGGVEISEQGNVSKVLSAVEEGASEVGTTYLSDTIGHEDKVKIIETVPYDVTGDIIYPVAQIENKDADDAEKKAASDFIAFITNDDAKKLYQQYGFDTDVE
ncbi:MAG: molybdate ABC transporter substrate-binding protein [Mogibacterium sp.]|nr:molybdate ABC transporter substrate-binding protein [Mogibacterium sp.]